LISGRSAQAKLGDKHRVITPSRDHLVEVRLEAD